MNAIAVIGAAFGDEGKGRMVDHFSAMRPGAIVVRYNGGGQAAHTVVTPRGDRYVFHHLGAGSLVGAATYLSRFFIVNPILWKGESDKLAAVGVHPDLYIHPDAMVSTPYDMLLNRELEQSRGAGRHGSCGYGINETVERFLAGKFRLKVWQLKDAAALSRNLERIKVEYVPERLRAVGIKKPSPRFADLMESGGLIEKYLEAAEQLLAVAKSMRDAELGRWKTVVFEGAQGLLLDEGSQFFPHVTRSRTGIANVADICRGAGIKDVEAVYVMRAYMTRHGHGPLPTEVAGMSYSDETNTPNEFQGSLRFGHLDLDLIANAIRADLSKAAGVTVTPSVAMTCLDQVGDTVSYNRNGIKTAGRDALGTIAVNSVRAKKLYLSYQRHRKF